MFSLISGAIVLFSAPAVFWHMLWVLSAGGRKRQKARDCQRRHLDLDGLRVPAGRCRS